MLRATPMSGSAGVSHSWGVSVLGCLSLLGFAEPGQALALFLILLLQVKSFLMVLLRKVTCHT